MYVYRKMSACTRTVSVFMQPFMVKEQHKVNIKLMFEIVSVNKSRVKHVIH